MTTTNINDTLVQLESLYTAYDEILKQAKEQLESFDITDDQVKRVAEKIESSRAIQEAAKEAAIADFVRAIQENDIDFWRGRQFVDKISDLVVEQVKQEINEYVGNLLKEEAITTLVDRRLAERVNDADDIKSAFEAKRALKYLIDTLAD